MRTRNQRKRARSGSISSPLASDDEQSGGSSSSSGDDAPGEPSRVVTDHALVGSRVQIPSANVWPALVKAVSEGAATADALIEVLGGEVILPEVPEVITRFTLEACLSVLVDRAGAREGGAVRVLRDDAWTSGTLLRGGRFRGGDGQPLPLGAWWYPTTDAPHAPRALPAAAAAATREAMTLDEGRRPSVGALTAAARLLSLPQQEAQAEILRRMEGRDGRAAGDRVAVLGVLAIDAFQTPRERAERRTIERNGRGWGRKEEGADDDREDGLEGETEAERAARLVQVATQQRRLFTRQELEDCHSLVRNHAGQLLLLEPRRLAAVLAYDCPSTPIAESSGGDDEGDGSDFVAPDDPFPAYPEDNGDWAKDLGVGDLVLRYRGARFFDHDAYRCIEALNAAFGGNFESIFPVLKEQFPDVDPYSVHAALCLLRPRAWAVGQRVFVAWATEWIGGTVLAVLAPTYIVVAYDDGDRAPLEAGAVVWHYVAGAC